MNNIKEQFPIFESYPNLIYLDSAATTQKPKSMLAALEEYYLKYNSNIGRGSYDLALLSETKYIESKKIVSNFIGCSYKNIVYTSGTTESLNLAAFISKQKISKKYIVLPITEHHANILIWQRIAKDNHLEIYWVTKKEEINNPSLIDKEILKNSSIFSIAQVSNVTGELYPIKKWCEVAKEFGAISIIDGAQGITSSIVNLKEIDCDFYAFSAHKLYGPMGLGVLFMKDKFIDSNPLRLGGGIIEDVDLLEHEFVEDISRFEAGTPNVANAFAFGKTIEFLNTNRWNELLSYTHSLGIYLHNELLRKNIKPIYISDNFQKTHISSFSLPNIHAHDIGTFLSQKNIAVRVGKHCTYPLHNHLHVSSTVRASLAIYNTKEDVDHLIEELLECIKYFNQR